jgi:hypothetical protein
MSKTQKNEFNISGKVLKVGLPEYLSDKFTKSFIVMEVWKPNMKNPEQVQIEFINENIIQTANVNEEDWVNVDFILKGRGGDAHGTKPTKYFVSLEGLSCTVE